MDIKELNINQDKGTSKNHPWEYARAKVIDFLIKRHLPGNNINGIMADVGCGDIFFSQQFVKKHPNLTAAAIDIAFTDEIIASLKAKYNAGNILFFNDIKNVDLQGKCADIVFLMDVIEHIENDIDFLKTLGNCNFVDDNTLFVITVPAYNNLYCSHDKWLGHYRRYDQKMLKEHTQKAGLRYVNDGGGYFFTSLLLPRWIQKKVESHKVQEEEVTGIGGWTGSKTTSKIYELILLTDFYFFRFFRIFGIKTPGLSTYALCKRQ